jgi:hypothetical protein
MLQPQELFVSWDGTDWRQSPFKWEDSLEDSQTYTISQTNSFAYEILSPTDWYVTREVETGFSVPANITAWRQAIRDSAEEKAGLVEACETKDDLSIYAQSEEYLLWPDQPT